ncbi:MFS transporter [Bradyrhizobium sp. USDA 4350]
MTLQRTRLSSATTHEAAAPVTPNDDRIIETSIPVRLDNLSWSGFHTRVVLALGITWILDGLEVTLAGALSGALKESPTMSFSNADVGLASSAYLAGAVLGALGFGWLTDRIGRKKLFFITLALYLSATAATALSWNVASYALFRFLTGAGIGGEYTAINSTIQELVPARYRGWTDLVINGSFWIGAAIGAVSAIVLLDPALLAPDHGWRIAYFTGAVLGLVVLLMRMWIPRKPALADDPWTPRRGPQDRRRYRDFRARSRTAERGL